MALDIIKKLFRVHNWKVNVFFVYPMRARRHNFNFQTT